jgi:hypothetical protein
MLPLSWTENGANNVAAIATMHAIAVVDQYKIANRTPRKSDLSTSINDDNA